MGTGERIVITQRRTGLAIMTAEPTPLGRVLDRPGGSDARVMPVPEGSRNTRYGGVLPRLADR
jgi:hypothetical protein